MNAVLEFEKLAKQAEKLVKTQMQEFDSLILNVEKEEDRKILRDLMSKAKQGKITQQQLIKEINGHFS